MTTPLCPCGECRPSAMTRHGICRECDLRNRSKPTVEAHHPWGRAVAPDVTVMLPANWHGAYHAADLRRPAELRRPGDNPVLVLGAAASAVAAIAEMVADHARRHDWPEWTYTLAEMVADAARSAANWLLAHNAWIAERLGGDWHREAPLWRP